MGNNLTLRLDETNNLKFKITIKGISQIEENIVPTIRFNISEKQNKNSSQSFIANKIENDIIEVNIQASSNIFNENKEYEGNLEVIFGNKYFVPSTFDINFLIPIKIEAILLEKKEEKQDENFIFYKNLLKKAIKQSIKK